MSDEDIPTTDTDEIDIEEFGVPTQRVRLPKKDMRMARPYQNLGTPQSNEMFEVEVPDMDRIESFIKNGRSLGKTHLESMMQKRMEATEKAAWNAIREIGKESDLRHFDASDEEDFIDVIYKSISILEQHAGSPEDAEIFVHPKTNRKIRRWIEQEMRFDNPMDIQTSSKSIQVAGFDFQILETSYLEPGELVMADTEIRGSPIDNPFTYVTNLPVGIELTIKVNGSDNQIEVNR
jgi:hypothetical protein